MKCLLYFRAFKDLSPKTAEILLTDQTVKVSKTRLKTLLKNNRKS